MPERFTILDNSFEINFLFKTSTIGALLSGVGYSPITVGSVEDMVNKPIAKVKSDKIEALLMSGHGYPGAQAVGCGRRLNNDDGKKSLRYEANGYDELPGGVKKHLRRLRTKFTNDAVTTLGGCNVAKGDEGKKLLSLISYETDTFVEACDETQRLAIPGWEGNVIRCYRDTHWVAKAKW